MKLELPEFRKCCFCIPLRYGLLVWGYIKLVISVIIFLFATLLLQMYMQIFFMVGVRVLPMVLIGIVTLILLLVDIAMTVVFLIGGHRKTTKLIRVFHIYSVVLLSVLAILFFISTIYDLSAGDGYNERYRETYRRRDPAMSYGAVVTTKVAIGIVFLGVQAYIILLLRSEINKLNNSRNFTFTNIATEAACAMENRNNEPQFATVHRNRTRDSEIGSDDQHALTKSNAPITQQQTFNYDKF